MIYNNNNNNICCVSAVCPLFDWKRFHRLILTSVRCVGCSCPTTMFAIAITCNYNTNRLCRDEGSSCVRWKVVIDCANKTDLSFDMSLLGDARRRAESKGAYDNNPYDNKDDNDCTTSAAGEADRTCVIGATTHFQYLHRLSERGRRSLLST